MTVKRKKANFIIDKLSQNLHKPKIMNVMNQKRQWQNLFQSVSDYKNLERSSFARITQMSKNLTNQTVRQTMLTFYLVIIFILTHNHFKILYFIQTLWSKYGKNITEVKTNQYYYFYTVFRIFLKHSSFNKPNHTE